MSDVGERVDAQRLAPGRGWTFLTHHGHVLLAVAQDADLRVKDLASRVGITERAALGILKDLEDAGYVKRTKVGRRTHYTVYPEQPVRHPTSAGRAVEDLLRLVATPSTTHGTPTDSPTGDTKA